MLGVFLEDSAFPDKVERRLFPASTPTKAEKAFQMRQPLTILLLVLTCAFSVTFAAEPRIEVALAKKSIVRGDCQLILVTVLNPSDQSLKLDWAFTPGAGGPLVEMQFERDGFEGVIAMGQGRGNTKPYRTIVPAQGSIAEFMLLALEEGWYGEDPLFERAGKYALRASIGINKVLLVSKPQEFEVSDRWEVVWPDNVGSEVFSSPKREFLDSLPRQSLLRESGELLLAGRAFVESPDWQRESWLKARAKATPLLADKASLNVATQFVQEKDFALALEELNRMKAQPQAAVQYKATCKELLGIKK
jgi:hypothetical protein